MLAQSATGYGTVGNSSNGQPQQSQQLQRNEQDAPLKSEETTPLIPIAPPLSSHPGTSSTTTGSPYFSCFSDLIFQWFVPVLDLGNQKDQLQPEDLNLVEVPDVCTTANISKKFKTHWQAQLDLAKSSSENWFAAPSLLITLYRSFGLEFIKAGALKLVHDLCLFVGPQVLNGLIHFLRNADAPLSDGLYLTLLVTVSQLLMTFCLRHYFFKCYLTGLQIRSAVVVAVYEKALVLKSSERQTRSLGEITNLVSIDAQRMQDLTTYLHAIWYSFVQIGLALYFLWGQMGPASLGGIVVMLTMMPVTKVVAEWLSGIQKKLMKAKDARVEVNSEILGSMKVIKLQAWEESFQRRLLTLRDVELQQLWHYALAQALSIMMWSTTPLAVALATFAAYILAGHELDVASALTALALFDILRFPLFMLPQVINRIVEASVSMNRISSFLQCEEHELNGCGSLEDVGITLTNASFVYDSRKPKPSDGVTMSPLTKELLDKQWEIQLLKSQLCDVEQKLRSLEHQGSTMKEADKEGSDASDLLCLKRINFSCKRGELVAVVGGVGCGKSSFVNAVLGEIRQLCGETAVRGKLSYFAQSAFILNDTVRNNILFGHTNEVVDEELYQKCLSSCALTHDLKLLPAGDQTEIGEKGITLSGGQKARVALARTVYHNADIAILDDPLAAVDAHVGKHLFQKCILDQLLAPMAGQRNKSVILVTNALQYLSHSLVDRIVVLQNGRVVEEGTYKDLANNPDTVFSKYLAVMSETGVSSTVIGGADVPGMSLTPSEPDSSINDDFDLDVDSDLMEDVSIDTKKPTTSNGELMTNEFKERVVGSVDRQVYLAWGRAAGGVWVPLVIVLAYGIVECVNVSSKWWLTYWSAHGSEASQMYFLGIYAVLNIATVLANFLRLVFLMNCGLRASRKMFARLLSVVLYAPMSFFDTTPIGRIVNRFSSDMNTIDMSLIETLRSYLVTLFSIFSTIIVISIITPIFTVCLIPIVTFYTLQQVYFTATYRELKRLDSVGRSPIYALLGETLDGVSTIRAFGAQNTFSERLRNMLDRQQHAYYLISAAQCWLGIRLEMVGTMIVTFACLSSVLQHRKMGGNETFAGLAGLAISYSLSVTQSLNWSVRMASDFEANMIAVERVEQYCSIESEAARSTPADATVPENWPEKGEITFSGAKLRYRPDLPLVLKGLDIRIPAGAKVGVVGRTGAGKSTLMVAMLRIVELDDGKIIIDGVDHSSLGLAKVRSKISVIPQDPVLFSGTIRSNLDPFEEYSDERLMDVLSRVGLYSTTSASTSTNSLSSLTGNVSSLHDTVTDGGTNFSVGQRQLLVIARALLCGSNIVIMDEATAAVDADTDARIQKVMRKDFAHATCLTVAHRINTILDSNYILVMSDGQAAEFDTPRNLMDRGGLFRELVEATMDEIGE